MKLGICLISIVKCFGLICCNKALVKRKQKNDNLITYRKAWARQEDRRREPTWPSMLQESQAGVSEGWARVTSSLLTWVREFLTENISKKKLMSPGNRQKLKIPKWAQCWQCLPFQEVKKKRKEKKTSDSIHTGYDKEGNKVEALFRENYKDLLTIRCNTNSSDVSREHLRSPIKVLLSK